MIDEAKKTVTAIRQMEASIDDSKPRRKNSTGDDLKLSYPLIPCLKRLKEKHGQVQKQHRERFEQVKSEWNLYRKKQLVVGKSLLTFTRFRAR